LADPGETLGEGRASADQRSANPAGRIKGLLTIGGRFCRSSNRIGESTLRIQGKTPLSSMSYRAIGQRTQGSPTFAAEPAAMPEAATGASPVVAGAAIEALLALQGADDPLRQRRKAVRRGTTLLDTLEDIKSDLLVGRVSEGRLNQLLAVIGQAREKTLPALDAVIDDIELRARVELAKFGRYAEA
jgi:hypothetical protein